MKHKVFVYGSLRKGLGNHGHLAGSHFLGDAALKNHDMHDYGYFPAIVQGSGTVQGEVYEVGDRTLHRLDLLEGHPKFYVRVRAWVTGQEIGDGELVWVYIMQPEKVDGMTKVDGGDWVAYRRRQPNTMVH